MKNDLERHQQEPNLEYIYHQFAVISFPTISIWLNCKVENSCF